MRFKKELYKKEQEELADKIIKILDLKENSITLYDIDNDEDKKQKINSLIPEVRKYFNFSHIKGAREPEKVKRPYLSLVKHITRIKYEIKTTNFRIQINNHNLQTRKYTFIQLLN
jgi:hypothetical protein